MEAHKYQKEAKRTEKINWANPHGPDIARLGIIGEAGSLAAVLKKHTRDGSAYVNYEEKFLEESGDLLWYVVTIASRLGLTLHQWPPHTEIADDFSGFYGLYDKAHRLSSFSAELTSPGDECPDDIETLIKEILSDLDGLARLRGSSIQMIANAGADKNLAYWIDFPKCPAREFDSKFPWFEQLPREYVIDFHPIDDHSLIMFMNGLQVGDRLTDNSHMDDGYRFHDIFHVANAAFLGWSPVLRSVLKRKRKSDKRIDEVEDGARAAIIEEAIVNHIYDYARPNFLEGMTRVDPDIIKRVQNLVRGYEVQDCEAWEWKQCILESYRVFRLLRENNGGKLRVNANERLLEYLPP